MEEWKEIKLSDVAMLSTGFPFKGELYSSEGVRVVRGDNVTIGELRWPKEKDKRWNEPFDRSAEFSLQEADIVIGMDGSRVGYNRAQIKQSDLPLLIAQRVACVRNNEKSLQSFLYYQIFSNQFTRYIRNIQTGSAIPHVSLKQIGDFKFHLPSIEEQRSIASILSALDDKIAVNRRICENLEAQAQALFKHWFIDFAPFKNGQFVESELGMIPEGWRVGRLDELGDIVGGATPSKAEDSYYTSKGIAWLTPKDLSNKLSKFTSRGEIDLTQEGYNSCSAKLMPKGSVLFSSRAPIGYLTIAKNDICTNQGFKSVVPKYAGTAYIYYLLKINTKRIESMSSGTTFKEASGSLMKSLAVIIPPKSIIDHYEASVVEIFNEQEVIEDESARLSTLRDTLLPKLMSGQIKV